MSRAASLAAACLFALACGDRLPVQRLGPENPSDLITPFDAAKDRPRIIVSLSPT